MLHPTSLCTPFHRACTQNPESQPTDDMRPISATDLLRLSGRRGDRSFVLQGGSCLRILFVLLGHPGVEGYGAPRHGHRRLNSHIYV